MKGPIEIDYGIDASSDAVGIGLSGPEIPLIDFLGEPRDDGAIDSGAIEYRP